MNESVLSFKDKYFGDKNFYKMTLKIGRASCRERV